MKNGIKIGMIWAVAFLLLFPVGNVMAVDIGSDTDTNTTITCIVQQGPVIQYYNLNDSANNSMLNGMLDVQAYYHFVVIVNQSSGWTDMTDVNITAWYDNNDDSAYNYGSTTGTNLKFYLVWDRASGTFSSGDGNVNGTFGIDTAIDSYTHKLEFYFKLGYQMRHANVSLWNAGPGWNDAGSWNFRITATSAGGSATADDEFGVYKYTFVYASGNPSATTNPGTTHTDASNVMSPAQTLRFRTNDVFWLNVTINDLTSGSNTITADNVWIRTQNGDVTTDTQFTAAGTPIVLYGTAGAGNYHAAYDDGNEQSDTVTWSIDVPLGTPVGTYTSPVTYTIEQP